MRPFWSPTAIRPERDDGSAGQRGSPTNGKLTRGVRLRLGEDATFAPALVDAWATDAERRVLTIATAHAVGDAPAVARTASRP